MTTWIDVKNKWIHANFQMKRYVRYSYPLILFLSFLPDLLAQNNLKSIQKEPSNWNTAIKNNQGFLKIYYTDSEGFISKSDTGLRGIEYEMMLAFVDFVQKKYKSKISLEFIEVKEFSELYEKGKNGKSGEFFAASFSITPARLKEVKFSPAYMPDIEIMICSENLPVLYDTASFAKKFADARGVVVKNSTYEDNLLQIKAKYLPDLKIEYVKYYDDIRDKIAKEKNLFSYSQLASYLLMKQKGISFKRQNIFKIQKIGQGIIYPKQSDWDEPINAFFNSPDFKILVNQLVRKYLGDDIKDLVWDLKGTKNTESQDEIMLLTKEKELQLMDIHKKEIEIIRKNNLIFYSVVGLVLFALLVFVLINRYQLKQKSNRILLSKNTKIEEQRAELISQTEELVMQKEQIQEQSNLIIENHEQLKDASKKVIDSIRAAKTIQFALLPFVTRLKKNLGEHFIIYHPKDIVSGDFYWVNEIEENFCGFGGLYGTWRTWCFYDDDCVCFFE
jgi:Bacterial extracellular solute-binding proteins, family 3